jgi:phosphomannomutase
MSRTGAKLSQMVSAMQAAYPASGEINRRLQEPERVLERIERRYAPDAESIDRTDGISLDMGQWRFNLRMSNTEPVIRLNVESRGDAALMREKTDELLAQINDD